MNENRYDGATREELLEAYDQLYAVENAARAERLRVVAAMERPPARCGGESPEV